MPMIAKLLTLILAAHAGRPDAGDPGQLARLRGVAEDIVYVATEHPIWPGAPERTAAALYAVARHESGFWSRVQDCSICYPGSAWCDRGRSVSLYQIRLGVKGPRREELCSSNRVATQRAAEILRGGAKASTVAMFSRYAGCWPDRPCKAARELDAGYRAALAAMVQP